MNLCKKTTGVVINNKGIEGVIATVRISNDDFGKSLSIEYGDSFVIISMDEISEDVRSALK